MPILLIDKPAGITSFDVIRILRKKIEAKPKSADWKMGHAGTLDPFATGLLIIGTGNDTKRMNEFLKLDKTYEAEILLGVKTETGDVTGRQIQNSKIKIQNLNLKVKEILKEMIGKINLAVPAYSAIKRGGEALYKKARRGEIVETPIREMVVKRAELKEIKEENKETILCVEFEVGSGTYIRSLGEEIGRRLGTVATLKNLRRIKIGDFIIENAERL